VVYLSAGVAADDDDDGLLGHVVLWDCMAALHLLLTSA
jgi:hypothetical protein